MEYWKELLQLLKNKISWVTVIILIGSINQLIPVFGSGLKYGSEIRLFGNNAYDGVMHLSYSESIIHFFPPREPGAYGLLIKNYHFWTDLVIAELSRIWHLPVINLFFQFIPLYLSFIIGITAYLLVKEWGGSKKMALWFVFLLYFASDAAYSVILLLHKTIAFNTPAIDSGTQQFLNMPHMFGKFLFLAGLISFHKWIQKNDLQWGIVTIILFSVLFGFKIYFGIFAGIGLGLYTLLKIVKDSIRQKKIVFHYANILLFLGFCLIAGIIFLPHNSGSGGLVFVYLEWPRSLLGVGSIDWRDWWLRRQVYEQAHNTRNLILLDILAVIITYISIYGTRILGFFMSKKLFHFLGFEKILLLLPSLFIFQILGLFTIQASGGVNVFNFFSVSSVVLSLFSAYLLSQIPSNFWGKTFIIIFLVLTLPRTIFEIQYNIQKYSSFDYQTISSDELSAFQYINKNVGESDVVQAHPDNGLSRETPYVAFFANRPSYLSGIGLLSTHNVPTEAKQKNLEEIFHATDIVDFTTKIRQKNIQYLYLKKTPEEKLRFKLDNPLLKNVFENKSVVVLQVH